MADEPTQHVPLPPARLKQANVVELREGEVIHRVHKREYHGDDFNPCKGSKTRFAPIYDERQRCIPTLYAADTVEAAIYETILHDVPLDAELKTIPRSSLQIYQHSILSLGRLLRLASLRAPDLIKWNISRKVLLSCTSDNYEDTARWATRIHDEFRDLDGMMWTSNLCDPASALLLFGDRVKSSDLSIESYRGSSDISFLQEVRMAAQRGDILFTI